MVIEYRGRLQEIRRDLDAHRDAIDQRYTEVLGYERARKVYEASERLLTPESFLGDIDELRQATGSDFPHDTANKFGAGVHADFVIDEHGYIKGNPTVHTAPFFYISEAGFEASSYRHTNRPLASYVHEYNHFIFYLLQEPPLYLMDFFAVDGITPGKTFHLDIFMKEMEGRNLSPSDVANIMKRYAVFGMMKDSHERATEILDRQILGSIGIDIPLEWRGKNRIYMIMRSPLGNIVFPMGGDPFASSTDEEVVENMIGWVESLDFRSSDPYFTNLLGSLKGVRIRRHAVNHLEELEKRLERRNKRGN